MCVTVLFRTDPQHRLLMSLFRQVLLFHDTARVLKSQPTCSWHVCTRCLALAWGVYNKQMVHKLGFFFFYVTPQWQQLHLLTLESKVIVLSGLQNRTMLGCVIKEHTLAYSNQETIYTVSSPVLFRQQPFKSTTNLLSLPQHASLVLNRTAKEVTWPLYSPQFTEKSPCGCETIYVCFWI